ncbi:preprotein translocase subunit SecY [Candidatus Phytoplasma luffae]|uniref:Protein translocase subunit SecY n=1 Tax=Loofah witches'-broom phytoplasma TaxID=35773 RepID=E3SFP9_LOWBP|nr:preprotein translocase subunit SecY [Candidatus Phytoplasma luffae]ADO33758.1 protein translocase [Candidatus Phytoplasma luffae]QTX02797.1 preprotein translocase subunit SecY [Candidatus Phytoplasma luffae]
MKKLIIFLLDKKRVIQKVLFTLFIVFIYIIGTKIYIPFLGPTEYLSCDTISKLKKESIFFNKQTTLNLFALSIFPYITASILVQFSQKIIPFLKEWSEQGDKGKYKINLTNRILTLFFALGQGWAIIKFNYSWFLFDKIKVFTVLFFLVVGVFICIWLSDLITSKGVGNGVSILIVVGITKQLYDAIYFLISNKNNLDVTRILVLFLFLVLLIFTIILSSGYLKIPINYALNKNNNKIDKYIPIKVNISGVLPIILAETLLNITSLLDLLPTNKTLDIFISILKKDRSFLELSFFLYILLLMLFSFFSSFMTINPNNISEHLSQQNAYLTDTNPGTSTVKKITYEMFKLIFIGAIFLTLLAISPYIINFVLIKTGKEEIAHNIKLGGTSLLIVVGTVIEFIQSLKEKRNIKKSYNKLF